MASQDNPSAARFKGFCFDYDRYRPTPPAEIMELAAGWTGAGEVELVVDLGCGTGLSTRPWATRSRSVIGIDPSEDMLAAARAATSGNNITYELGTGQSSGLGDTCADIITCSSAAHWMEPKPTVEEITRVLKRNGILVVYGHYYPVFLQSPALTSFYERWRKNLDELEYRTEKQSAKKWPLTELYAAVNACGLFEYSRRHYMHSRLSWSAEEIDGFFRAHAGVPFLLGKGYDDDHLLLKELAQFLTMRNGQVRFDMHFTYSVFIAARTIVQ